LPHPAGFPPLLAILAVLFCAGGLTLFYQALFPRPARWPLIGMAFLLGVGITAAYAAGLAPAGDRLAGITDAWSALKTMALAAGLPEEAVKLFATVIALFLFTRNLTPAEAFQTSLVAALGFAALENLQYARALPDAAVPVAFGRGIVASFVHSMMGMIQGAFLASFVRSGWRHWHLPILGYLVAATAHSLFDWGLVRPLIEYFQTKTIKPETVMGALPIAIPSVLGVIVVAVSLFCWELRKSGRDDALGSDPVHQAKRARWRKVGDVMIIVGAMGFVGSIAGAVIIERGMQGQPPPTDLSQVTPEQLRGSIVLTVILAMSPMLILFGTLVRNKR
jgi:RsiW-degrading membrane proteinase PrsW (M82 family)